MNTATLSGVISAPQIKYNPNDGKAITEFYLSFVNPSKGESIKQIKCSSFGTIAELIIQLQEGQSIILVGAININNQEINGNKTRTTEFRVSSFDAIPNPVNLNSISIVGRTGQDTDIKYFESGTNKATNSLAVRRTKETTDWFNLEVWGKTAEVMANYVRKGNLIGVSGQLKYEEWTDKNTGQLQIKPVINVAQLDLLGKKEE